MMYKSALSLLLVGAMQSASAAEPIQPIEPAKIDDPAKVALGKKLFFEPRLSKSGVLTCNSCHNLAAGGSDNRPSSIGHKWAVGPINSPTVLNAGYNLSQFWDGRAKDLAEQAGGPIANPKEMGSTHELAVKTLKSIPEYRAEFNAVYKGEITIDRITDAIGVYEETLVTPNSRFDQWLKGNKSAITAQEKAGYDLFKSVGCTACHNGPAVGGTMYQKMGLVKPYKTSNPAMGRFDVTKRESDKNMFKVPVLRNIELTYPYFHDGSVWDLKEAVTIMADIQLGRQLTDDEATKITAFLKTLTGELPDATMPPLPPSTAQTPRPSNL